MRPFALAAHGSSHTVAGYRGVTRALRTKRTSQMPVPYGAQQGLTGAGRELHSRSISPTRTRCAPYLFGQAVSRMSMTALRKGAAPVDVCSSLTHTPRTREAPFTHHIHASVDSARTSHRCVVERGNSQTQRGSSGRPAPRRGLAGRHHNR